MPGILETVHMVSDDYQMQMITIMRRLHRQGNHWLNAKMIADEYDTRGTTYVTAALYRLAASGFLYMRDGDGKNKFEYQLRPEYQR
jgi:hypothetical protein